MGVDTQAKILRVLQDRKFMHLGGVQEIQVDVRIIAATNVDLRQLVKEGKFPRRSFLSPERDHDRPAAVAAAQEDIPLLVELLPATLLEENGKPLRQ